jgi:predicted NUDIX family NTP pyrophosphohydrolase
MKQSAGILPYRSNNSRIEVMIGHIGGPWMAKKDKGAWSIIKGEFTDEAPLEAAKREFKEETSLDAPDGKYIELGEVKQKNNKTVTAYAVAATLDTSRMQSNTVEIEWPPRSGSKREYPETDRFEYFDLNKAAQKLIPAQVEFLERLAKKLGVNFDADSPAEEEKPKQNSLF